MSIDTAAVLAKIIGPYKSVAESAAINSNFAKYEQDFVTYSNQHWTTEGAFWEDVNYYDRAFIYYVWYARTNDPEYLMRANAIAESYLNDYLVPNRFGPASWWSMPKGIACHYLHNGDALSLEAIGKMADQLCNPWNIENDFVNSFDPHQCEGREQARMLEILTLAILLKAPSVGVPWIQPNGEDWGVPGGHDYLKLAARLVNKILTTATFQKANGSRPHFVNGTNAGLPIDTAFMNGIMNDALINFFEQVYPEPRIPGFIKKNLDFTWTNMWLPTPRAFQYIDKNSSTGETAYAAPDLNGLLVNGYGWYYSKSLDPVYKTRGDAIFNGGVFANALTGSKQFNQQYSASYRYAALTR